jgi:iron(III) transport system permease protein
VSGPAPAASAPAAPPGSRRRLDTLAAVAIGGLLVWLVGYPLLVTAADAAGIPASPSFAPFRELLSRPDEWLALWRSLWTSLASVVAAAAIGVPLAFLFARGDFPGRRTLSALLTLPVALPPLVGVIAFLFLWGESGFASRAVQACAASRRAAVAPRRLAGDPPRPRLLDVRLLLPLHPRRSGAARPEPREAAAALGASRARTLFRVTLPALRPALAGATLITFLTALASFSAPYLFGGGFRVMTTQIVASRLNGNHRLAMTESLLLAAVALIALRLSGSLSGAGDVAASGPRARAAPEEARGVRAIVVAVAGWLLAIFLLLPHATLLLLSLVPTGTWTVETLPPRLDLPTTACSATPSAGVRS